MHERAKVLLQCPVEHLRLTVDLRMVSGAHAELGPTQLEQFAPEITDEDGIAVRYKATRKPMEFTGGVEKKSGHLISGVMCRKGPEMRSLGIAVDHHQDDCEAVGRGKTGDEIKRQIFPNVGRD